MGEKPVAAVPGNDDNGGGGGGGGGGGEGMHCPDHPYRSNPGGICAFCLQERLGKLVSSTKSSTSFIPVHPSSSSSSPSFSATPVPKGGRGSLGLSSGGGPPLPTSFRHRMLFLSTRKKRESSGGNSGGAKLNRSSSVAPSTFQPMDSPRRRWFWFLHHHHPHHHNNHHSTSVSSETKDLKSPTMPTPKRAAAEEEESERDQTPPSSYGRKVARSRSVGCGSRSFSGDFLERISTGLGDCALRRVESQREQKIVLHRASTSGAERGDHERVRCGAGQQRVRCGGIFGGFGISTPSSSSYWLPAEEFGNGGGSARLPPVGNRGSANGKGRGWGWAFASPIRAFRQSSKTYGLAVGEVVAPTTPNGRVVASVSPVNGKSTTGAGRRRGGGGGGGGCPVSSVVVARGVVV